MNKKKGTKQPFYDEEESALLIKQILTVINYLHKRDVVH